jgi:hypothetical protein
MNTESIYDKKADLLSALWDGCRVETPMELGENMYRVWLDGSRFMYVSDEGDSFHILGLSNVLLPKTIYNTAPGSAHSAKMQNILRNYQKPWNIQTEEDLSECAFWYFTVRLPDLKGVGPWKAGYVKVFGKNFLHAKTRMTDSYGNQWLLPFRKVEEIAPEDRVLIDTIVYF